MKTLATLDQPTALLLAGFLKNLQIPFQCRQTTAESGVESTEILVDDERYEAACDATDKWQEALVAEVAKRATRRCPQCNSPNLECRELGHKDTITQISVIYLCKECGRVFAPRK